MTSTDTTDTRPGKIDRMKYGLTWSIATFVYTILVARVFGDLAWSGYDLFKNALVAYIGFILVASFIQYLAWRIRNIRASHNVRDKRRGSTD